MSSSVTEEQQEQQQQEEKKESITSPKAEVEQEKKIDSSPSSSLSPLEIKILNDDHTSQNFLTAETTSLRFDAIDSKNWKLDRLRKEIANRERLHPSLLRFVLCTNKNDKTTKIVQSISESIEKLWSADEVVSKLQIPDEDVNSKDCVLAVGLKSDISSANRLSKLCFDDDDDESDFRSCVTCGENFLLTDSSKSEPSSNTKQQHQKPQPKSSSSSQSKNSHQESNKKQNSPADGRIQLPCGHFVHSKPECCLNHKRKISSSETTLRCFFCLSVFTYRWKKVQDEKKNDTNINNTKSSSSPSKTTSATNNSKKNTQSKTSANDDETNTNNFQNLPWMIYSENINNNNEHQKLPLAIRQLQRLQRCQLEKANCQNIAVGFCETHNTTPPLCEQHIKERHNWPECKRVDLLQSSSSSSSSNLFKLFCLPCPNPDHRRAERRYFDHGKTRMLLCSYCRDEQEKQDNQTFVRYDDEKQVTDFADAVFNKRVETSRKFFNEKAASVLDSTLEFYSKIKKNQKHQLDRLESYHKKVHSEIDRQYTCTKTILENQLKLLEEEYKKRKTEANEQFEETQKFLQEADSQLDPLEKLILESSQIVSEVTSQLSSLTAAKKIHPCMVVASNAVVSEDEENLRRETFPDFVASRSGMHSNPQKENDKEKEKDKEQQEKQKTSTFHFHKFISRPVPQLFSFSTELPSFGVTEEKAKSYLKSHALCPVHEEEDESTLDDDLVETIKEIDWVVNNFKCEGYFLGRRFSAPKRENNDDNDNENIDDDENLQFSPLLQCRPLGKVFEAAPRNEFVPLFSTNDLQKMFEETCWGDYYASLNDTCDGLVDEHNEEREKKEEETELEGEEKQEQENRHHVDPTSSSTTDETGKEKLQVNDDDDVTKTPQSELMIEEAEEDALDSKIVEVEQDQKQKLSSSSDHDQNKTQSQEKIAHDDNIKNQSPSYPENILAKEPIEPKEEDILRGQILSLVHEEKECLRKLKCWIVCWHDKSFHAEVFYDQIETAKNFFHNEFESNNNKPITRILFSVEQMEIVHEWYWNDFDLRNAVVQFAINKANAIRNHTSQQLQLVRAKLNDYGI